eukprot:9046735-Pyramimonas_sp.AAC.1
MPVPQLGRQPRKNAVSSGEAGFSALRCPLPDLHGSTLREQSSSCRWAIDRIELRFSNLDRPARG